MKSFNNVAIFENIDQIIQQCERNSISYNYRRNFDLSFDNNILPDYYEAIIFPSYIYSRSRRTISAILRNTGNTGITAYLCDITEDKMGTFLLITNELTNV